MERTLLRYHAALELDDEYGRTALVHAEQNGSPMNVGLLLDEHGVNLTLQNEFGQTSLALAIKAQVLGELYLNRNACTSSWSR